MSRDERRPRSESASRLGESRESGWFGSSTEGESYPCGCSMLSRIRLRPRNPKAFATMRCSLGYALHSQDEVAKCLAVEGPADCWKTAQNWRVTSETPPQLGAASRAQIAAIARAGETQGAARHAASETKQAEVVVEHTVEVVEVTSVSLMTNTDDTT